MEDKKIYAIPEGELKEFLTNLGLFEKIKKGELVCGICERKITFQNLYCVYPSKGEIKVCCNNLICIQKMGEINKDG